MPVVYTFRQHEPSVLNQCFNIFNDLQISRQVVSIMPHYRCCVCGCSNDNKWPEKIIKRGHVEGELRWHCMKRKIWEVNIGKGRLNFKATNHQVRIIISNI